MVNTFIIAKYSQHKSRFIRKSASLLDTPRLGKQRVEAMQILNNLYAIKALCLFFNITFPDKFSSHKQLQDIINRCRKQYVEFVDKYKVSMHIDEYGHITNLYDSYLYCHVKNIGVDCNGNIRYNIDCSNLHNNPYHTIKKLGYANHTCTYMWWGYEEELKYYINVHIDEWISRGHKNTMHIYNLKQKLKMPKWSKCDAVVNMFACALLYKERVRIEKKHYGDMEWIVDLYSKIDFIEEKEHNFTYYTWPSVIENSWEGEIMRYDI